VWENGANGAVIVVNSTKSLVRETIPQPIRDEAAEEEFFPPEAVQP
jgi:hypothetical protein